MFSLYLYKYHPLHQSSMMDSMKMDWKTYSILKEPILHLPLLDYYSVYPHQLP